MKKLFALLLALTLIVGASGALASGTTYITLGTGGTTGTYYALGAEIAAMWMQNIEGLDVTVTKVEHRRVLEVRVQVLEEPEPEKESRNREKDKKQ